MEVIILQTVCMLVLFVVMTLSGILPVFIMRRSGNINLSDYTVTVMSLCNCLAGGVFIGMCFLGLIPFVREKFSEILKSNRLSTSFPIPEFVIVTGFFLILTVEQIVQQYKHKVQTKALPVSADGDDESQLELLEVESFPREDDGPETAVCGGSNCRGHSHVDTAVGTHSHQSFRNLVLLFVVSIHTLFEGMALGLQTDNVKILHLFLAILLHEVLVLLATGINVAKHNMTLTRSLKCVVLVTGSIPVGMMLGFLIGSTPGIIGSVISAIFQATAVGIFLYVTFMEIIPEEFSRNKNQLLKVLFFFVGFMVMSLVTFSLDNHK